MSSDLHPDLDALAPLLGAWAGHGSGKYPTIQPFDYVEEVVFAQVGKPFVSYSQKTSSPADGKPLHAETGYLRVPRPRELELVLAHSSGITEVAVGAYSTTGTTLDVVLTASTIGLTPTAKEVSTLRRWLRVHGDELTYTLQMGAVGQPLQDHLTAVLHRKM